MDRQEALDILHEHTASESLRKHAYAVEAAMRAYALRFAEDPELWGIVGLLHDFDYEKWPEAPDHTQEGAKILRARGVGEEIVEAVLSHAQYNAIPRDTPLKRTIFAVDELCGLITAVAYVRPSKLIADVKVKSVKKKMKDKAFSRAVNRDEIREGAKLLELELDEHIQVVLEAMQGAHEALGL